MRFWRALVAGLGAFRSAFLSTWRGDVVTPVALAAPAVSVPVRYQVVRKVDGRDVLVYNEFNGGEASRLFCAERDAGNVAEFWMDSPSGWKRRDWCPR